MARHREWPLDCKIYIGELGDDAIGRERELEDAFGKFGPVRNCWVARNPSGFAFIEMEDARDADDACRALDGTRVCGRRVRVEMSHGRTRRSGGPRGRFRGGGGGGGRFGGGGGPRRFRSRSRSPRKRRSYSRSRSRSYSRGRRSPSYEERR